MCVELMHIQNTKSGKLYVEKRVHPYTYNTAKHISHTDYLNHNSTFLYTIHLLRNDNHGSM